jgi:hypothetical protein
MRGIRFVVDERGRKVAAIIDLKIHRKWWGDVEDVLVSRLRRPEKRIPLRQAKSRLIKTGKLT